MFLNKNSLPTDRMIAGTTRKILFYLYEDSKELIDTTEMVARFSLCEENSENYETPIFTKPCTIVIPDEENMASISVILDRDDTLHLDGKYIYQVTINNNETIVVLQGVIFIENNYDKLDI